MIFEPTKIDGVFLLSLQPHRDERGFFARTFCADEFGERGLATHYPQCNTSFNEKRNTVRGLHFQSEPKPEVKIVRCTSGAIYDVVVDIRPDSPTFCQWVAAELTAENRQAFYVPAGCAHGYQTLTDRAEVFYMMSEFYDSKLASGVRWNDPRFQIEWPLENPTLSPRDAQYPDFRIASTGDRTR